jgi:hypothetical protein
MRSALMTTVAVLALLGFAQQSADARAITYRFHSPSRADPQVNVYLSARYDRLLQTSPRFRAHRMWKECHTITWPELHNDCIASFDQYEPVLYR